MNINQLLEVFTPLNKQKKELLYDILLELVKLGDKKTKKKYLEMLQDFKEDLLYVDEEDEELEKELNKIYVTQDELAVMFNVSKRTIQRIIKRNNLEPVNQGSKPYYYDFDEFKEYYFSHKSSIKRKEKKHSFEELLSFFQGKLNETKINIFEKRRFTDSNDELDFCQSEFYLIIERNKLNTERYPRLKLLKKGDLQIVMMN